MHVYEWVCRAKSTSNNLFYHSLSLFICFVRNGPSLTLEHWPLVSASTAWPASPREPFVSTFSSARFAEGHEPPIPAFYKGSGDLISTLFFFFPRSRQFTHLAIFSDPSVWHTCFLIVLWSHYCVQFHTRSSCSCWYSVPTGQAFPFPYSRLHHFKSDFYNFKSFIL